LTHSDKARLDRIEKMVNPPLMGKREVLCPPLGSIEEYMRYLEAHREDYRRLFGDEG
jgi:hypothetical protein